MSNGIASLTGYSRLYFDPKNWQQIVAKLPDNLKLSLPTVEEIEHDLRQLQDGMGG